MPRRVVVTGVGLLSSVGTGTEECWSAIRNGKNGIELITQFDASEFSCRIAGEVEAALDPDRILLGAGGQLDAVRQDERFRRRDGRDRGRVDQRPRRVPGTGCGVLSAAPRGFIRCLASGGSSMTD